MDEKFTDLLQALKSVPSDVGAKLVDAYRSARPPWGPADDRWYGAGSYGTASGIDINEKSALKYSPFFCGVRKIAETVASLPRHVYRDGPMGKKKALDHYLYPILHHQPNSEMTSMQMREAEIFSILLWGNAYSYIQRNMMGEAIALWPLDASRMQVKRPNPKGLLIYEYTLTNSGETVNFPPWEILHIAGPGFNGLMGISVISLARDGIATGMAYEEYSGRFFSNNATPAGFIEVPGIVDKETRANIRKDWYEQYGGVSKSQLIGIIGQGMKFNPLSQPARDSQFLEQRKFGVEEMCRWLNVPPHWIYNLDRATNNNIEQQSLEVVIYTLRPLCVRIEQQVQMKLIMEPDISMEHRLEGLLRGDTETRTAYYSAGRQWGWLSVNDILALENMELVEDGDERLTPQNMTEFGASPDGTNGKDKQMEKLIAKILMKKQQSQLQTEGE